MAFVIHRVDLLGCLASDARMRDEAADTVSVPLASAGSYYLRETVPEECSQPLTLAFWESGHDLVIKDGSYLQPHLAAGAQIYAAGRLHLRFPEMEGEILCRSEVVCMATDVLVPRGPDGGRPQGSPAVRSRAAFATRPSDMRSSG